MIIRLLFTFTLLVTLKISAADKPCSARQVSGQSVICVCTPSYCDEIVRQIPGSGKYVAYTSSKAGSRFLKTTGNTTSTGHSATTFTLDPTKVYQTIEGFGGAVTDAAGINWKNLTRQLKQSLIDSYYSSKGLEYNMIRTPIGGCDFSTHPYAYNELPINDTALSNYSLAYEDYEYKIPMIKAIIGAAAGRHIHIVATTWSPPPWMKTNNEYSGSSHLKPEYFQTYADYHLKYIQKYDKEGIKIWGITITNEPINGIMSFITFNSLGWSVERMGHYIAQNLGPTLRNSNYSNVKIISVDDNLFTVPLWFDTLIAEHPEALPYIDGVGIHYYDKTTPMSIIDRVSEKHPDKFIIATEACEGPFPWQTERVLLGSWGRAKRYILDILDNLNHNVVGWIDWNLCLNAQGGPNWVQNFVDSPIIVFPEKEEFVKQPMFYGLGHFSKFIPRGSRRIAVEETKPLLYTSVENVAFITPSNTVVTVLHNNGGERDVTVKMGQKTVTLTLEANSVLTMEMLL